MKNSLVFIEKSSMENTMGSFILEKGKIILKYNDGYKQIFQSGKIDYSVGAQWINWNGERYFLNRN